MINAIPETNTFDLSWNFPVYSSSGEHDAIPLFSSHQNIILPLYKKHLPIYVLDFNILCINILIWAYDFGFTRHRGIHLLQIAIESFDDIGLIYLIGSMNVEDIGVALCGDLTMISDSSSLGWWANLRKLYEPGSLSGLSLILNSF